MIWGPGTEEGPPLCLERLGGPRQPFRTRAFRSRGHSGFGVVYFLTLVVVAVLSVLALSQLYFGGVLSQEEQVYLGRRAYYLADSAINEALLSFRRQVNTPGLGPPGWFELVRKPLGNGYGGLELVEFDPALTKRHAQEAGFEVERVRMAFWRQKTFLGLSYEKHGILTIDAKIRIPRKTVRLMSAYTYRTYRKAYEVKVSLVGPPYPFDSFTFFIRDFPWLQQLSDAYEEIQRRMQEREVAIEEAIDVQVTEIVEKLQVVVEKCQEGVNAIDEAREWARTVSLPFGISRSRVKRKVEEKIEEELNKVPITEDLLRTIAASDPGVIPASVPALAFDLREVVWPPYRTGGQSLSNHAYVTKQTFQSSDVEFRDPDVPGLPEDPTESIPSHVLDLDWPPLRAIIDPFQTFQGTYEESLVPYETRYDEELRRYEALFKLVPDDWMQVFAEKYLPKMAPQYYQAKACRIFPNEAAFEEALMRPDRTLYLDGVYVVGGSLEIRARKWRGSGAVIATRDLEAGPLQRVGDGALTLVAGRFLTVRGALDGSVLAPYGQVNFTGQRVRGTAAMYGFAGDGFTVEYDPTIRSELPERLWASLAPFPTGTVLLRTDDF